MNTEMTRTTPAPEPDLPEPYGGIYKEITASMILQPVTGEDKGWNEAMKKARKIVKSYSKGEGIFQLGATGKAEEVKP